MLVVTAHPGIGAGLEALLRLEHFEVRRIARPADRATLGGWRPDAVLVDAASLHDARTSFGAPTFILAGNAADGERLARSVPGARGWLPKDATAAQLRSRLADPLVPAPAAARPRAPAARLVAVAVLLAVAAAGVLLLYAQGAR